MHRRGVSIGYAFFLCQCNIHVPVGLFYESYAKNDGIDLKRDQKETEMDVTMG